MIEFYSQIKLVHIACVIATGSLFALRGLLVLSGAAAVANHYLLRWLSYAIDTTLLTAAFMLMTMLHQYPLLQHWLTVKIVLLIIYVALGVFALRRGRSLRIKALCYCAALLVFLFIVSVAWWHDPRGALNWL